MYEVFESYLFVFWNKKDIWYLLSFHSIMKFLYSFIKTALGTTQKFPKITLTQEATSECFIVLVIY